MAEKDVTEKILESYNDVFSDIVNVLLFGGKEVVAPDELEDQAPRAYYKADGKVRELERDVAKRWKKGSIRVACKGAGGAVPERLRHRGRLLCPEARKGRRRRV